MPIMAITTDQADDLGRPAERESRWRSIGRSLSPPFDKGQQQEEEAGNGDGQSEDRELFAGNRNLAECLVYPVVDAFRRR